jgi:hypothetical protein
MELASSPVRPIRVLIYRVFQGTILEIVHEYDVEILQGGKVSRGYTGKLNMKLVSGPVRPVRVLIHRVFQGTILETVHEYDVEILQGIKVVFFAKRI